MCVTNCCDPLTTRPLRPASTTKTTRIFVIFASTVAARWAKFHAASTSFLSSPPHREVFCRPKGKSIMVENVCMCVCLSVTHEHMETPVSHMRGDEQQYRIYAFSA